MILKKFLAIWAVLALMSCQNTMNKTEQAAQEATQESSAQNFEISLAQWSIHNLIWDGTIDPMDFASVAKDLGYTGLEYVSNLYVGDEVNYPMKAQGLDSILKELKRRSDSLGMTNVLIMVDDEGDLSLDDETQTTQAVENHKKWVDAAAFLGCHAIRVNLFGASDPQTWVANSVRSLKALSSYAAEKNISILVENHGGLSSDGKLLAQVMEEVGMDNCGTLVDFGNFCVRRENDARWDGPCMEEYDRYQGVEELMPYAHGVSAKSYAFDAEGNETTMDFPRILNIVRDAGFSGFIGVEFEGPDADPFPGMEATKALIETVLIN
ncbi:MAG: sugar phosphate isomerase/epimerase [Bacteroidetes bacterium]|nr:sugar phosphate isomerase/epimerase [Bacteroidota bacterium]